MPGGAPWFPGNNKKMKKMEGFVVAPLTARGLEIAKNRGQLLDLLHDLPESEHELSLTDLVEKGAAAVPVSAAANSVGISNEKAFVEGELSRSTTAMAIKETRKKKKKKRRSSSSSSDGVLLNFYVPASLTRSLTTPPSSSHGPSLISAKADCNKRDRGHKSFGCLSALWDRRRGKSRRQENELNRSSSHCFY